MNKNNASNPTIQELGHSPDALAQRKTELMALLAKAAPELISDQQLNVAKLQELLGEERLAADEHYELLWAGKAAARREIQKTSSHTLRPDANNPAQAQHMLIEGENLEVLRVLQKSYYGKVKMIYIDPPYNTGNDSFVYPDDYSETLDEYQKRTGEKNEAGYLNKQSLWKKNSKESGQYHSAWLSMMFPRLYLARNLLRDDGFIAIQIDDNEYTNLKILCDEIFGEENLISSIAVKMSHLSGMKMSHVSKKIPKIKEFILIYAKSKENINLNRVLVPCSWDEAFDRYGRVIDDINLPPSEWTYKTLKSCLKDVEYSRREDWCINNAKKIIRTAVNDSLEKNKNNIFEEVVTATGLKKISFNGEEVLFAFDKLTKIDGVLKPALSIGDIWADIGINNLHNEGGVNFENGKKPVKLLSRIIKLIDNSVSDEIFMDFFAGSGTTAEAVMTLNAEDGGNRRFIAVQIPETLSPEEAEINGGCCTIADITSARINKVIAKLKAEHPGKTNDLACAHFSLAPSNFKVWQGDVKSAEALREQLSMFQSAEKGGQSKQSDAQTAMLTELLLKHGLGALGVHAIAKPRQIAGVTIHRVLMSDDKPMWLCFETYSEALKEEIVKAMPAQVVMLNTCFVGAKADEQLANLQLELAGLDIGLTVI